jgi:nucleotide-binding universal stress UspA family protein
MFFMDEILVPIDFSDCSDAALDYAVELANRHAARLDTLHVWEGPPVDATDGDLLERFAQTSAGEHMRDVLARIDERLWSPGRGRLVMGDPSEKILEVAERFGYDLIVMGTHGRKGIVHTLLGGVAERVIRRATCPVLTIRTVPHTIEQYERSRRRSRLDDDGPALTPHS